VLPDQAAELLQLEERGLELLQRCDEDAKLMKAIQQVVLGFAPRDVAKMYGLDWVEPEVEDDGPAPDKIHVWVCKTNRCMNREKVTTATNPPNCPRCRQPAQWLMDIDTPDEISHMARMSLPNPGLTDPLARTDRTKAPDHALGDFD
jgi:hypothetical protein